MDRFQRSSRGAALARDGGQLSRRRFMEERELLPVGYAHVFFTLPHALAGLAFRTNA